MISEVELQSQPKNGSPSQKAATKAASDEVQLVEFLLGGEQFAIDLFDVKEIVEYSKVTELPDTPPYIRGVIDLRGEIYTIVDLKNKLNVKDCKQVNDEDKKVVVMDQRITNSRMGMLVDNVQNVSKISSEQIEKSTVSSCAKENCIIGIIRKIVNKGGKESTELVIFLDIKKVLQDI